MKGFDTLHIKSAVKNRNKFDLSRTHLTTMDFGEIVPLMAEETVPGDDFKVSAQYFSRMAPLAKPTYGKFSFKTVAGFVPYHQIADDAEAWLAGKTTWEGETPRQRTMQIWTLGYYIISNCTSTSGATAANADIIYTNGSGAEEYRKFTKAGKYYVKVLNALGYAIPESMDFQTGSTWRTKAESTYISAYPLLAFFKLYNDYMSQSQRYNSNALTSFLKAVKHGKSVTGFNPANGSISYIGLDTMFSNLKLQYENDYFTSAWQRPNSPTSYLEGVTSAEVPAVEGNGVTQNGYNNELLNPEFASNLTVSQRALDFLKSFDDWVRRNNYSGSRAVQQVYSRFGIKTDDYRSNYAHVLSTDVVPVSVGDVTATAQQFISDSSTKNVALGDYAGKGIVSGDKGVECKADDYGIFIILGYFTVAPMNAYGFDRKVLRNTPLDYYNPEFDGIGADAISAGEFYASPIVSPSDDSSKDDDVFGFTERYNSYRYGRDMITGEFRNFRNDSDMNTWHTGRLLTDIRKSGNLVAQSSQVNSLAQTDSEYNRMFSITDGSVNHFYLTAQFKVDAYRPMLNLNQVVKLGEGDTTVPRNGNVIN